MGAEKDDFLTRINGYELQIERRHRYVNSFFQVRLGYFFRFANIYQHCLAVADPAMHRFGWNFSKYRHKK